MNERNRELTKYREMMYRLLSSVYINEIDADMLEALRETGFPDLSGNGGDAEQELQAGFGLVKNALAAFDGKNKDETAELLEDLAADYAKTFLAAGDAAGKAAFPYESVYTGTDSAFGGSVQMQLNALYAAKGLQMKKDMFAIMEDHIGLELGYMAEMLKKQAEAGSTEEAETLELEMMRFFSEHLANWTGQFAADVYKYSDRDFYKGIARLTRGFIEAEKQFIAEEE